MGLFQKLKVNRDAVVAAFCAVLMPVLVQFAQAIPITTETGKTTYLIVCAGNGIEYRPVSRGPNFPEPAPHFDGFYCPVCTTVSFEHDAILPENSGVIFPALATDAFGVMQLSRASPTCLDNGIWPRAPPLLKT